MRESVNGTESKGITCVLMQRPRIFSSIGLGPVIELFPGPLAPTSCHFHSFSRVPSSIVQNIAAMKWRIDASQNGLGTILSMELRSSL
jgi:hypothetical protein